MLFVPFYSFSSRKNLKALVKYVNEYGLYFVSMPSSVRHVHVTYHNAMQFASAFVKSRSSSKLWMIVDVKK